MAQSVTVCSSPLSRATFFSLPLAQGVDSRAPRWGATVRRWRSRRSTSLSVIPTAASRPADAASPHSAGVPEAFHPLEFLRSKINFCQPNGSPRTLASFPFTCGALVVASLAFYHPRHLIPSVPLFCLCRCACAFKSHRPGWTPGNTWQRPTWGAHHYPNPELSNIPFRITTLSQVSTDPRQPFLQHVMYTKQHPPLTYVQLYSTVNVTF